MITMIIICVCAQDLNSFAYCHINIQEKYGACLVVLAVYNNKQLIEAHKGVQRKNDMWQTPMSAH